MNDGGRSGRRATSLLGPAALYVVYIFVMGSIPGGGPPSGVSDKLAHAVAFGLLVPLLARAARFFIHEPGTGSSVPGRLWGAAVASAGLGGVLELWQSLLPARTAEVLDFAADSAGAVAVAGLLVAWHRIRVHPT